MNAKTIKHKSEDTKMKIVHAPIEIGILHFNIFHNNNAQKGLESGQKYKDLSIL